MARTGVFISHAHEDRDLAASLAGLLRAALELNANEITCTSDADYGLERGADLREQLTARLHSAKALFLLATPASHTRDWVQYECAIADAARDDGLDFYIVTPLHAHRDIVPDPYVGRVSVTLSNAQEVHAFVKQLRTTFGRSSEAQHAYVEPLLDLVDRCAPLELAHQCATLEKRVVQSDRNRKAAVAVAIVCGVLAAAGGWAMLWAMGRDSAHANAIADLKAEHEKALVEKEEEWSQAMLKAQAAADEEFKQFSLAGLFQDSRLKPLRCKQVEVYMPDDATGRERSVKKDCDGRGTFIFSPPELQVDARVPIRLKAFLGGSQPYEFEVRRVGASLPFLFREGQ